MSQQLMWHPDMPESYRNAIVTGDAKILARDIPDESVDLIFCDPIYQRIDDYRWLAETAARVLKPERPLLVFHGIGFTEQTYKALREGGRPVTWSLPIIQCGQTQRIHPKVFNHWYSLLWAGGEPVKTLADVCNSLTATLNGNHRWRKNLVPIAKRISEFSHAGSVIADFFCGGGTIPAVCKILGRNYVAFEINPATADLARRRVRDTQPPLPGLTVEQMEMAIET